MSIEANNLAGPGDETRIVELAFTARLGPTVRDRSRGARSYGAHGEFNP